MPRPSPSLMRRVIWCNGHGSWVMWVMGQLCDGSWVTKNDPFPSLLSTFWVSRCDCQMDTNKLMKFDRHTRRYVGLTRGLVAICNEEHVVRFRWFVIVLLLDTFTPLRAYISVIIAKICCMKNCLNLSPSCRCQFTPLLWLYPRCSGEGTQWTPFPTFSSEGPIVLLLRVR